MKQPLGIVLIIIACVLSLVVLSWFSILLDIFIMMLSVISGNATPNEIGIACGSLVILIYILGFIFLILKIGLLLIEKEPEPFEPEE